MKMGYLVPEWPSHTHAFFWHEIEALRAAGVDVHIISTRAPSDGNCHHDFAKKAIAQTHYLFPPQWVGAMAALVCGPIRSARAAGYIASLTESILARAKLLGLLTCAADLLKFCRQHQLDHLHVHSCAHAAHLGALCRILGGPPYSLTLHGDLPVYGVDHDKKMARASFVATVTRPLQEQVIRQIGIPRERVPVLWMGVDTDQFIPGPARQAVSGSLRLLTISRLQVAKGHKFLLAGLRIAIDHGCDISYTIAGDGPDKAAIVADVERYGLTAHTSFIGPVSQAEVLELLHTHDAFALPSVGLGEAAPVAVMEAMSCGLPVICSRIGGTPDMISDRESGLLVDQLDETGLAQAMEQVARDLEMRRRLGSAARERAIASFDLRQTTRQFLDAITSLSPRALAATAAAAPSSSTPPVHAPVAPDNRANPPRSAADDAELVIS